MARLAQTVMAGLVLVVGIVLSPLRAVAATIPTIIAYDVAGPPAATTALGTQDAVRPEAQPSGINDYDGARLAYLGAANTYGAAGAGGVSVYGSPPNPCGAAGAGAVRAYDPALEILAPRDVTEGVIYGAPATTFGAEETTTLFHYTTEEGMNGILESEQLNPSLKALNPADARYGNGQYLSDITPGSMTPAQLSRQFLGMPFQGSRFTNWVEIDVSGLNVVQGRPGVFVVPNEGPLDLAGRIVGSGGGQ